jgi:hypothetical protein
MKIVKRILLVFAILIAILLIVAIFVPKQYTVSVSTTIKKPKSEVMDYIKILANQKDYSEWVKADTTSAPIIEGIDGTVGAKQKWNSTNDNVGEGEQEIMALTSDRMDMDLRFIRPFKGEAKAANILESVNESETKLTSEFYGYNSYPSNLMGYFIGKKIIEETQTKNLNNIKTILEAK